jgi:hypothetical protein
MRPYSHPVSQGETSIPRRWADRGIDDLNIQDDDDNFVREARLWLLGVEGNHKPHEILIGCKIRVQTTSCDEEFLQSGLGFRLWCHEKENIGGPKYFLRHARQPEMSQHSHDGNP